MAKKKKKKEKIKPCIVRKAEGIYILEFAPHCRTIKVNVVPEGEEQTSVQTFHLSFPYVQFSRDGLERAGDEKGLIVTFSQKPLKTSDDLVYFPSLPNIDDNPPQVCLEGYYGDGDLSNLSDEESIWKPKNTFLDRIDYFWNSIFTGGVNGGSWAGGHVLRWSEMKDFRGWQKKTKKDPSFILTAKLGKPATFETLTRIAWGDDDDDPYAPLYIDTATVHTATVHRIVVPQREKKKTKKTK